MRSSEEKEEKGKGRIDTVHHNFNFIQSIKTVFEMFLNSFVSLYFEFRVSSVSKERLKFVPALLVLFNHHHRKHRIDQLFLQNIMSRLITHQYEYEPRKEREKGSMD